MPTLRKLSLITDTWHETNGVTTTMRHTVDVGTRRGFDIEIMHPGLFPCFPNPIYRQ